MERETDPKIIAERVRRLWAALDDVGGHEIIAVLSQTIDHYLFRIDPPPALPTPKHPVIHGEPLSLQPTDRLTVETFLKRKGFYTDERMTPVGCIASSILRREFPGEQPLKLFGYGHNLYSARHLPVLEQALTRRLEIEQEREARAAAREHRQAKFEYYH